MLKKMDRCILHLPKATSKSYYLAQNDINRKIKSYPRKKNNMNIVTMIFRDELLLLTYNAIRFIVK